MFGHRCSGCSKFFRNLALDQCQRCLQSTPKAKGKKPSCVSCGDVYEFLEGSECDACSKGTSGNGLPESQDELAPNLQDAVRYAMDHPENARTYSQEGGRPSPLSHNPHTPASCGDLTLPKYNQLRTQAEETLLVMQNSYQDSVDRSQTLSRKSTKLAPPKFRGIGASSASNLGPSTGKATVAGGPPNKINVVVIKVINQHDKEKMTSHDPIYKLYSETTPWDAIVESIRQTVDTLYMKRYQHRVYTSEGFSLYYDASSSKIPEHFTVGTLGMLWSYSSLQIPLHMTKVAHESRTLKIYAVVDYPPKGSQDDAWGPSGSTEIVSAINPAPIIRKRKSAAVLSDEEEDRRAMPPPKKLGPMIQVPPPSRQGTYISAVHTDQAAFVFDDSTQSIYRVQKLTLESSTTWVTSSETFSVCIDDIEFDSGLTKQVHKMIINNEPYAAKRFYDIGDLSSKNGVSYEDNMKNLKDEVSRQSWAKECLSIFQKECIKRSISVYNLNVEIPFILESVDGFEIGLAWIVDRLLDNSKLRKFSGTAQAGNNADFIGKTCDALAHYSLYDSNDELVLVDIQGIVGPKSSRGVRSNNTDTLTLFDTMFHTSTRRAGLGDQGQKGINAFKNQHLCNSICQKLGIKPTATTGEDDADPSKSVVEEEVIGNGLDSTHCADEAGK